MEGLPNLETHINLLTPEGLADFNRQLDRAETFVTFLGSRIVRVEGFQNFSYIDAITSKILNTAPNCTQAELHTWGEIVGKLRNLYHAIDAQMENSCCLTKILIWIRNFFSPSLYDTIAQVDNAPEVGFAAIMPFQSDGAILYTVNENTTEEEIEAHVRATIEEYINPPASIDAIAAYLVQKIRQTYAQAGRDIFFYKSAEFWCGATLTIAFSTEVRDQITPFERDPDLVAHRLNFDLRRNYIHDCRNFQYAIYPNISVLNFGLDAAGLQQGIGFHHGDERLSQEERWVIEQRAHEEERAFRAALQANIQ